MIYFPVLVLVITCVSLWIIAIWLPILLHREIRILQENLQIKDNALLILKSKYNKLSKKHLKNKKKLV